MESSRERWLVSLTLMGVLFRLGPAGATTHQVPGDFATITAALVATVPGDTVQVAAGLYSPTANAETFPLRLLKDDVVLLGAGMGLSILDAEGTGSVLIKDLSDGGRISGFTITGGDALVGGGVAVRNGSIEVDHNLIIGNLSLNRGAGLFVRGSATPWVHHNVIWENFDNDLVDPGDPHGVVYQNTSAGIFEHNLVGRGDSNGLLTSQEATPIVRHNIFYQNGQVEPEVRGRGICVFSTIDPIITYNLFFDNEVAALLIFGMNLSAAAANDFDPVDEVYGNLDGDPLFVDADNHDWHLQAASPAIDAGDSTLAPDPDGTVADIGPFFFDQSAVSVTPLIASPLTNVSVAPNPFRAATAIRLQLDRSAEIEVEVVDVRGRQVRSLFSGSAGAGDHHYRWDGRNDHGRAVASGVYLVAISTAGRTRTSPMVIVR